MMTGKIAACLSSKSDEWETPPDLFAYLNTRFHFTLDVAATRENTKCPSYYTMVEDGLRQPWNGSIWCNPPYTRHQAKNWVLKAIHELNYNKHCNLVMFLLPVRTDTLLWHDILMKEANEICFIQGRVGFLRPDRKYINEAPFPSCLVLFTKNTTGLRFTSLKKSEFKDFGKQERLAR